ncbi:MAG: hypothetical protein WDW36_008324 [Sanguina aurantia]
MSHTISSHASPATMPPSGQIASAGTSANAAELRTHPIHLESTASMDVPSMALLAQRLSNDLLRIPSPMLESPLLQACKARGHGDAASAAPAITTTDPFLEFSPMGSGALSSGVYPEAEHVQPANNRPSLEAEQSPDQKRASQEDIKALTYSKADTTTTTHRSRNPVKRSQQAGAPVQPAAPASHQTSNTAPDLSKPPWPAAAAHSPADSCPIFTWPHNKLTIADVIRSLPDTTKQVLADADTAIAQADMVIKTVDTTGPNPTPTWVHSSSHSHTAS